MFNTTMPKNSNTGGNVVRKPNLLIKLLPTVGKDYYQFRLLNFTNPDSKRDYPFIEKNIHEAFGKEDDGKGKTKNVYKGYVTCPSTNCVKKSATRGVALKCPICEYVNQSFIALKQSDYKDKDARDVVNKNKFRSIVCIPVYVINDPHNALNNGKPRVIVMRLENADDKEFYKSFLKSIDNVMKTSVGGMTLSPFNGDANSVNMIVQVGEEVTLVKKGTPEQYEYKKIKIQKMVFGKQPKQITSISEEMLLNFPFDDNFYTTSTADEINNFCAEFVMGGVKSAVEDVDLDDVITDTPPTTKPMETVVEDISTGNAETTTTTTDEDLDVLDELLDDKPVTPVTPTTTKPEDEKSIDDMCAELGLD